MAAASSASVTGQAKLDEVNSLLDELKASLPTAKAENAAIQQGRLKALQRLKVLGRDARDADSIFAQDGIEILAQHGFKNSNLDVSREALRCLANALLLCPAARQVFVNLGYAVHAAERLKTDNLDDEFLCSRILFLITYDTTFDFEKLDHEQQLADSINRNLIEHAKAYSKASLKKPVQEIQDLALAETLKLLFNLLHYYPHLVPAFTPSIAPIVKILTSAKIKHPPLQSPTNYLINALLNLDLGTPPSNPSSPTGERSSPTLKFSSATVTASLRLGTNPLFPTLDHKAPAEHLVNILDRAVREYPPSKLDTLAAPLLTLIRRVYEIAPDQTRRYMQWLLLPSFDERARPLGTSDTLSAKLLKLSIDAMVPTLREGISSLMFELSGKDAQKMVENVGYGFAAGFLVDNNMSIPVDASEAFATGNASGAAREDVDGAGRERIPINPITGQRKADEDRMYEGQTNAEDMSEEEKEREAERLFVLFERLKATGVVNVQNPVGRAIDEGRFEELDD